MMDEIIHLFLVQLYLNFKGNLTLTDNIDRALKMCFSNLTKLDFSTYCTDI